MLWTHCLLNDFQFVLTFNRNYDVLKQAGKVHPTQKIILRIIRNRALISGSFPDRPHPRQTRWLTCAKLSHSHGGLYLSKFRTEMPFPLCCCLDSNSLIFGRRKISLITYSLLIQFSLNDMRNIINWISFQIYVWMQIWHKACHKRTRWMKKSWSIITHDIFIIMRLMYWTAQFPLSRCLWAYAKSWSCGTGWAEVESEAYNWSPLS